MSGRRDLGAGDDRAGAEQPGAARVPEWSLAGIAPFDPARDAGDLRAFQLRMFGDGSRQLDRARARWLFSQNPFARPTGDQPGAHHADVGWPGTVTTAEAGAEAASAHTANPEAAREPTDAQPEAASAHTANPEAAREPTDAEPEVAGADTAGSGTVTGAHAAGVDRPGTAGSDQDLRGVWVCRRDGAIVGQQAEIPFELQVGYDRCRAAWAIDLMVDPDWRLQGVGSGLIATQLAGHKIVAGLDISQEGQAAYGRVGLTDLGIVPVYLRPLDARRALRIAPVPARLRRLAPLTGPGLRAADAAVAGALRARGARLVPVDRLDQRSDEVWERSARHYPVLATRDGAALAWRIDERPDRDTLRRYYLVRRGTTVGQVVLRPTVWSDEPVVVVVDYLAPPRWVAPLLVMAGRRAARRDGAVAILARTRNTPADRSLRTAGFIRRDEGPEGAEGAEGAGPPIRFMVHCTDEPGICALVQDPPSWFVTAADSDLEHATTPAEAEGAAGS